MLLILHYRIVPSQAGRIKYTFIKYYYMDGRSEECALSLKSLVFFLCRFYACCSKRCGGLILYVICWTIYILEFWL